MGSNENVDVVVVGAGFAGLHMLYRLRQLGMSTVALESGADVGGTWYWNRYPGARCDIPTTDYTYSFDPELEVGVGRGRRSTPRSRRSCAYLQHVADKHDLRGDIRFSTKVESARGTTTLPRGRSPPTRATRSPAGTS